MEDFVAPLIPEGGVNIMEGSTAITLSGLVSDAGTIISAMGTNFATLSNNFGFVLYIRVTLVLEKAVIGMIKGVLMFRKGRRR